MNRKNIDYKELAKQKKKEAYAKAISKLPEHFKPQPITQKIRARIDVYHAKKSGRLIMQPCRICGELKTEAHHPDYDKPLDVIWLCRKHHMQVHYGVKETVDQIIERIKYTEAQIIDNVASVIKSKHVLKAFLKRHTPKTEW